MPALLPATYKCIRQYHETFWRQGLPEYTYPFADLPSSDRLTYELVTWDNIMTYLPLFKGDQNPYLMDDFKNRADLEQYGVHLLEYGRYSIKRGACDWLLRTAEGDYVGVLHIHALSRELIDGRVNPCMIGYAIGERFRRRGFAQEAAKQLLNHLPTLFGRYEVMATVHPRNRASQAVLRKIGFRWKEKYSSQRSAYYKRLVDSIPHLTTNEVQNSLVRSVNTHSFTTPVPSATR